MKINSINTTLINSKRQQYKKVGLIPNDSISINFSKLTEEKRREIKQKLCETTDINGKKFFTKKPLTKFLRSIEKTNVQNIDVDLLQEKLLSQIDNSYKIFFYELRPFGGYQFKAQKITENEKNNYKNVKTITLKNDGSTSKETYEYDNDYIYSWNTNKPKTSIFLKEENKNFSEITIEYDNNNEPKKITVTRPSDYLLGTFEEKEYILSDYPADWDMIELIKSGKIDEKIKKAKLKKAKTLSKITFKFNRTINSDEEYTYNGIKTTKHYSQKVDKNNEIKSYKYSYKITDKDGSILLNTNRTWKKTEQGHITTINGEEYETVFDDKFNSMQVKIKKPDNSIVYFFPKHKNNDRLNEFRDFLKTLPADMLIDIKDVLDVKIVDNPTDSKLRGRKFYFIETSRQQNVLAHELGHKKALEKKISEDEELKKIYKEEVKIFQKNNPYVIRFLADYFLEESSARSSGLDEIVAETNAIMTLYGDKTTTNDFSYRMHYLTKYFPKTIAKSAELLGYNKERK